VAKGILCVESRPNSDEEASAYHQWYDHTHVQEMLGIDGFVAARRFAPLNGDGAFVAIYEIEADDLAAVQARLGEAMKSGVFSAPVGVQTDPPPVVRFYRDITAPTA
jgi:hypothetical protein